MKYFQLPEFIFQVLRLDVNNIQVLDLNNIQDVHVI
jgi:hypothetical protein